MRIDVLDAYPAVDPEEVHVVRNGIDTPDVASGGRAESDTTLAALGVDTEIARLPLSSAGSPGRRACAHLIAAARHMDPGSQLVLCAGAPDTPEIGAEIARGRRTTRRIRGLCVSGSAKCCPPDKIREILSAATVFVCPSVYEPLGIVNLEAMACETAVIASDVGGIPEVVGDGSPGSWCITTSTKAATSNTISQMR